MVGSMKPRVRKTRRDRLRQQLWPVGGKDHDRRLGARQHPLGFRVDARIAADHVEVARHQGEGLGVAVLQGAEPRHGLGAGRVARELEAAEPLDGDDLALLYQAAHGIDVVEHGVLVEAHRAAVEADEPCLRPACVAGDGLGVEAAVCRVAIFARRNRGHMANGAIVVCARS